MAVLDSQGQSEALARIRREAEAMSARKLIEEAKEEAAEQESGDVGDGSYCADLLRKLAEARKHVQALREVVGLDLPAKLAPEERRESIEALIEILEGLTI